MFVFGLDNRRIRTLSCGLLVAVLSTYCLLSTSTAAADDDVAAIAEHERWVTSLVFSPTQNVLATAGGASLQYRPGDVKLWDPVSGSLMASLEGHTSNVWSIAISPDGSTLITSGYDGKVVVWDVAEKKARATLEKHKGWCRSVAISPDGKHFASAGEDGTVVIWKTEGAEELKSIKAHESAVYQVAFSRDGSLLATASTDKTVKLWSWQEEEPKETAKLEGHSDAVWTVTFSPDGSQIATAGADRTIKLWDASGKAIATLPGHTDWISSLGYSPDGKTIASSSYDRTVRLWDVGLAVKMADELTQTAAKLQDNSETIDKALEELKTAEPEASKTKSQAEAIGAIVDSRQFPDQLKQVEAAIVLAGDNQFLKKAAEEAKAAVEAATKSAEEKTKAFAGDKEFAEKLKKFKEGPLADAVNARAEASKSATAAAEKVKDATQRQAAAEKAVAEARAKNKELAPQLNKTVAQHKSSVWSVAFSPDGKLLASGSHKDSLRVFEVNELKERFPQPEKNEEAETESGEE